MKTNILNNDKDYINRWVVSYADFVTLLLALFMVLYALTQFDLSRMKDFSSSIDRAFVGSHNNKNRFNSNFNDKKQLEKIFATTEAQISVGENIALSYADELQADFKKYSENFKTENASLDNLYKSLEKEFGQSPHISVVREPRGVLIRLNDTVLFDKGGVIIKNNGLVILDKIAVLLKNTSNPLKIEAYTDENNVKSDKISSNWEFSLLKASNINKYFVEKKNFNPTRILSAGYGQISTQNHSDNGENTNKINIVILSSSEKIFEPKSDNN